MSELKVLGVSAATTNGKYLNTHFLLKGDTGAILIDCPGYTLQRLLDIGIPVDGISDMILTHFHPDHVNGFSSFMLDSWLLGRKTLLRIFGPHHCLDSLCTMMEGYKWGDWAGFYPTAFNHVSFTEGATVLENDDFVITSWPVHHYVPTIGLRIEDKRSGFVLAYSSDTSPCDEVVRLGQGADILIHEATGNEPLGHTSAYQAGEIAARAGAKKLGLIHYNVWQSDFEPLVRDASETFPGEVFLCKEGMEISLG